MIIVIYIKIVAVWFNIYKRPLVRSICCSLSTGLMFNVCLLYYKYHLSIMTSIWFSFDLIFDTRFYFTVF